MASVPNYHCYKPETHISSQQFPSSCALHLHLYILLCSAPTSVHPPQQEHFGIVVITFEHSHCPTTWKTMLSDDFRRQFNDKLQTPVFVITPAYRRFLWYAHSGVATIPLNNRHHKVSFYSLQESLMQNQSSKVTICTTSFNIPQLYVLPTQCIYVFRVDLRTTSDYFPTQH
jgi:hypothetical protein